MLNFRESLETLDKADLIDKIVEICDNGFYPHELLQLQTVQKVGSKELKIMWGNLYEKAEEWDRDKKSYEAASILADGAEMCYEAAIKHLEGQEKIDFLNMLVNELQKAGEEDGIGMYSDDEWLYFGVRERIQGYLSSL